MAEKILNTRILLKVDTLENWNKSTLALKKGEIAIATVAATEGTGLTEPVCMIKIGEDGIKTFKDLGWNLYAKASDVLSACKTEEGLTEFINGVIADAGIATDEALTSLANRVATAEGNIDALEALVGSKAVATQISDAIAALKLADTYDAKGAASTAETNAKAYADGLAVNYDAKGKADQALADAKAYADGLAGNYDTKGAAAQALTDAKAYTDEVKADILGEGITETFDTLVEIQNWINGDGVNATELSAAIADEAKLRADADTAMDTRVKALEGIDHDAYVGADEEVLADAKEYADGLNTAMDTRVKAIEGITTHHSHNNKTVLDGITDDKVTAWDASEQNAKNYADQKITALGIADYVKKADADKAYDAIGAAKAVQGDTTKTVKDVETLVATAQAKADAAHTLAGNKATMAEVNDAISKAGHAAATDLSAHTGNTTVHITAAERTKWNAVEGNANTYADELNTAMNTRVEALEAVDHEHANKALLDSYTQTETNLADAVSKKHSHANATELAKIATGDKAKWDASEQNAKTYADGLNSNMNTRVEEVEGKAHEHTNKALLDTYTQTEANLADAVSKKHSHANATELAKIASGDVAKWNGEIGATAALNAYKETNDAEVAKKANDADLAAIAKTGNVNDLVQTAGDVLIFNCGDSTETQG